MMKPRACCEAIYRVHAAEHEAVQEIGAGDIAALDRQMCRLTVGETLLYAGGRPIALEPLSFPKPSV